MYDRLQDKTDDVLCKKSFKRDVILIALLRDIKVDCR